MDKAKRKPKVGYVVEPSWPLLYGQLAFVATLLYAAIVLLQVPFLFPVYGTLSGMLLTFFWPVFVIEIFLLMLANSQRLRGWRNYPKFTLYMAASLAVLMICAFFVLVTVFGA